MKLDRDTIVRTALDLLNEVGLEGLTLRRLAAKLDVQAPALYWHFKNKQALLDAMGTAVLAAAARKFPPPGPDTTWRDWARSFGTGYRRALLRYRDGARTFSGTYLTDSSLFGSMEDALRPFIAAGFTLPQAVTGLSTIASYVVGFTIEQQAVEPRPGERNAQYDLSRRAARIDADERPLAHAAGPLIFTDFDTRFDAGLELILAGLAQQLRTGI